MSWRMGRATRTGLWMLERNRDQDKQGNNGRQAWAGPMGIWRHEQWVLNRGGIALTLLILDLSWKQGGDSFRLFCTFLQSLFDPILKGPKHEHCFCLLVEMKVFFYPHQTLIYSFPTLQSGKLSFDFGLNMLLKRTHMCVEWCVIVCLLMVLSQIFQKRTFTEMALHSAHGLRVFVGQVTFLTLSGKVLVSFSSFILSL